MKEFDLNAALTEWRETVIADTAPEADTLEELESGLLDRYDEFLIKGLAPAAAFAEAREKVSPAPSRSGGTVRGATGALLGNYLKVAGRTLRSRSGYNLTNYLSLSLGIITVALAALYLRYETSYDAHLPEVGRKYRVAMNLRTQGYSMISFADFFGTDAETQARQIDGFTAVAGVERGVRKPIRLRTFSNILT